MSAAAAPVPDGARTEIPTVLAVMAKAPRPGLVKTRLCPPLSPEAAAAFYHEMLVDVLELSVTAAVEIAAEAWLVVAPGDGLDEVARLAPPGFRLHAQRGSGLSQRMEHVLASAAAAGAERVVIRGSDSPALDRKRIAAAADALDRCDLVLCPDPDGGYSLVGLRTATTASRALFDHPMSTQNVLDDTLARAAGLGLRTTTIEPSFDIDTIEDLQAVSDLRATDDLSHCRRTVAFIDREGLWSAAD